MLSIMFKQHQKGKKKCSWIGSWVQMCGFILKARIIISSLFALYLVFVTVELKQQKVNVVKSDLEFKCVDSFYKFCKIISSLSALYLVWVYIELNVTVPFASCNQPLVPCSYVQYAAAKGEKMWLNWLFSQNVWIHFTSLAILYPLYLTTASSTNWLGDLKCNSLVTLMVISLLLYLLPLPCLMRKPGRPSCVQVKMRTSISLSFLEKNLIQSSADKE